MTLVPLNDLITAAKTGNLISFPTDTVPALATIPSSASQIFQTKQRSQDKPLILMMGDISELWQYTNGSDLEIAIWQAVADLYLPGALTLVLPASDRISPTMNPRGDRTIGLRVPAHDLARSILKQTGALATTSANFSGEPPLLTMAEINVNFPDVFCLNIDADLPSLGQPSTVVQWVDSTWQILRQGAVQFII